MDDALKQKLRERLVARRRDQFAFLADLVRVPSENPPGDCADHAEHTAGLLSQLGFKVQRYEVPDEVSAPFGRAGVVNLVARRRPGGNPALVLSANGDTPPAGNRWRGDPYEPAIFDGKMSGRGVIRSKSDIAAYAFAILALDDAAPDRSGGAELRITYDGETGGELGAKWLLENAPGKPGAAIVGGLGHEIIATASGRINMDVEITGKSAAAARPADGFDAVEGMSRVLTALYALRDEYRDVYSEVPGIGAPTLVVSEIRGGHSPITIPGNAVLRIDRRVLPEEDAGAVEREIHNLVGTTVVKVDGVTCRVRRSSMVPSLKRTAASSALIKSLADHGSEVFGKPLPVRGTPHITDGCWYAAAGIPTVLYGAGPPNPDGADLSTFNETLDLDDLRKTTEVLALMMAESVHAKNKP